MFLKNLLLVTSKNFRLQVRRPAVSIAELFVPILAVLIVVTIRWTVPNFKSKEQCFVTYESDHLILPNTGNFTIFYTPNNSDTRFLASVIQSQLVGSDLIPMDSESALIDKVKRIEDSRSIGCFLDGAGIVFHELNKPEISYTIRLRHETPTKTAYQTFWHTLLASPATDLSGPRVHDTSYFNEGFLHLEHSTNLAIIYWLTRVWPQDISTVAMKQMPYPHYTVNDFLVNINFILPFMMMAAFLLSVGLFTKDLVREKETRIRETLKIMGLSNLVIGLSWILKQFLFMLLPVLVFALILKYSMIFPHSHLGALMILMLCYLISMISFSFLVSVWFNSSKLSMMAAFIFWFLTYIPHLYVARFFQNLSLTVKVLACLLSNTCAGMAIDIISLLELRGDGFQFSDFYSRFSVDDSFNMYAVIGMLLFDSIFYFLLAWYINEIKPGEYGLPKKFYFPFQLSYWTGKNIRLRRKPKVGSVSRLTDEQDLLNQSRTASTSGSEYEIHSAHELVVPEPAIGIQVKQLVKRFKPHQYTGRTEVTAVDHVDLKIYKGQITALLGHNAAGKSTLISLITSLYPPTNGSIIINGVDQLQNVNSTKLNIGICPQYNLLFDDLTVQEHLEFFARLKNVANVKSTVDKTIEELELQDYKKYKAKHLSGGYKRKLSVAIALVGDPDVLILDEPTSGMDFIGKNLTWELLQRKKNSNTTILLTTHNMDDAENADRLMIMVEGKLSCSGTPSFLKKRYGVGYNLKIEVTNENHILHIENIVALICDKYEQHRLGLEMQYLLPYEEMPKFSHLFEQLERCEKERRISSFSVQENRMVDVFIRVREGNFRSWESQVKQLQRTAPNTSGHRQIIPSIYSLKSVDSPLLFEGTENLPSIIEEEGSDCVFDGVVNETSFVNRHMSFSGTTTADGIVTRERRSSSMSSNRSFRSMAANAARRQVTPSILQSVYPLSEDVEKRNDASTVSGSFAVKTKRWWKQYFAMLVKRYYNFIRFRIGFVWQFMFPVLFVALGLIIAATIPNLYGDDPKRLLTLQHSAPEDDIKLFWGYFSDSDLPFNVEDLSSNDFGSPSVENITHQVHSIRNTLTANNETKDCCNYKFQILDSFCAKKTPDELSQECSSSEDFGYYRCSHCLSCCGAKEHQLASCSNPRFQQLNNLYNVPSAASFCPTPPKLSRSLFNATTYEPLDGFNVFVDELLLRKASENNLFFRKYLGGFTTVTPTPAYATCQCNKQMTNTQMIDTLNNLISNSCPVGRTPVFPSYCNENPVFQSVLYGNISSVFNSSNILDEFESGVDSCAASQIDLLGNRQCIVGSYCRDETCKDCDCYNQSFSSWYGDLPETEAESSTVIWYNNEHYHLAPAMLTLFHNLYLKKINNMSSIAVYNHPLPRNPQNRAAVAEADVIIFSIGMLTSFGFSFLVASYALFIVHEKASKAKHLQLVSGLHKTAYWIANLSFDMLSSLLPVLASFLLFVVFSFLISHFSEVVNLIAVLFLLLLVCLAEIPLVYLMSFLFENVYTAYTSIFVLTSMTTLTFLSIIYLINVIAGYEDTADILHYLFLLNPSYGLATGLSDMYLNHIIKEACNESPLAVSICNLEDIHYYEHPFELRRPGIGVIMIYLLVEGIVFSISTVLYDHLEDFTQFIARKKNWTLGKHHEHAKRKNREVKSVYRSQSMVGRPKSGIAASRSGVGFNRSMSMRVGMKRSLSFVEEDSSVRKERRNVGNMLAMAKRNDLTSDCSLVMSKVSKQYNNAWWTKLKSFLIQEEPAMPAVAEVNLTVKEKECFGLAGFNGAGKTTIFKILTGDIQCTTGVATICGLNIATHLYEVQKNMGYCPQFDALVERMTGREVLTMFARIKGLMHNDVQEEVREKIDLLNLNDHADKLCWKYSGGNKRKLSAAISLIGDPKLILLDEPTTGMDIETRGRFIEMLKSLVQRKKTSIILTSHSMGECEAVCNRIGILIKGEFRCIGSTEDLKAKYGEKTTKILIRVEGYVPTPESSRIASEIKFQPHRLQRTPSMYSRLQSSFSRVLTNAATVNPQEVIEEESGESASSSSDEDNNIDEVDGPLDFNFEESAAEEVVQDDEVDYTNKYLADVCHKFETEFGVVRAIKKIGCDADEVSYKLPRGLVSLSKIFEVMEKMKKQGKYHILSYSVTQSTLEQVYSFFAKEIHPKKE